MALRLPPFQPLPAPSDDLLEVPLAALQPTQLCVGMAEIRSRQVDFAADDPKQRRRYLQRKPTPLVRSAS
ncbi:MAG: ParB-like protein, partial [Vulcanococcus sp.]